MSGVVVGIFIGSLAGRLISVVNERLTLGMVIGLPFGLALLLRTRRWVLSLLAGWLVGVAGSLTNLGPGSLTTSLLDLNGRYRTPGRPLHPPLCSCRADGRPLGRRAGRFAGRAGGLFFFVAETNAFGPFVTFSLAGVLLGLTLAWWRPVLMYPFVVGWNNLLFRLDERRLRNGRTSLLRYHSAFWDEFQRLRLIGLDTTCCCCCATNPKQGRRRGLRQRRTAALGGSGGANRVGCVSIGSVWGVTAVSQAHEQLAAGELAGPASALLRSFSRISQDVAAAQRQESAYNQRLALSAVEDRLDGLVRELTRSDEPYANRFRPIATQWRQLIADQTKKLAEEAELRQEIDSPYIIGVPLTQQQEIFIGRSDISARIEQLLLDRRQPPLLLYGQRRVGKTSLLHNLGRLLPSTIVPLFVDLQGPASRAQDDAGFLYNVARAMVRSARQQRHLELPPLEREALAADPFTVFDEWLDELETALGDSMALLMLDEFEVLDNALAQKRFDSEAVLGMLRHIIQHRPRFKMLLSGSHTLDRISALVELSH